MPGKDMKSIKNKKTYEALKEEGMDKSKAAAISNAQKKKSKKKAAKTGKSAPSKPAKK